MSNSVKRTKIIAIFIKRTKSNVFPINFKGVLLSRPHYTRNLNFTVSVYFHDYQYFILIT